MVRFALEQMAGQRGAEFEVILALHGIPSGHPDVVAALASFDRPVTVFEAAGRPCSGPC